MKYRLMFVTDVCHIRPLARRWKDSVGLAPTSGGSFAAVQPLAEELLVQSTKTKSAVYPEPESPLENEVEATPREPKAKESTVMAVGRKIIDGPSWGLIIVVLALITLFLDDVEMLVFTWTLERTEIYGRSKGTR